MQSDRWEQNRSELVQQQCLTLLDVVMDASQLNATELEAEHVTLDRQVAAMPSSRKQRHTKTFLIPFTIGKEKRH